jgi:magnesium transporter
VRAISILSNAFLTAHPEDAARVLERLPAKDQAKLLASAPSGAGKVMARMAPPTAATCLALMNGERALHIVRELSLDFKLSLLRCMQEHDRERLLQALGSEEGEPLRTLLCYPDNTAGALMDPYLLSVPDDITAGEALRRMRASHRPVLYYLYVLDREHRLVGVTTLRELMRARPSYALSAVMRREVVRLPAAVRSDDIVKNPHWREFHALPVVDEQGRFLGAIRHETLRRVEQEVAQNSHKGGTLDTLLALGELYWVGLASLIPGVAPGRANQTDQSDDLEHKRDGE